jgi:hypothetical protein
MFITVEELEDRIGADRVRQLFDRDMDSIPEAVPMNIAVTDANAEIFARLNRKGYGTEQIAELARDETIRRAAAMIVAEFGAFGKPELISDTGTTFYTPMADKARKLIDEIAASVLRPRAEKTAGAPETMRALYTEPQPEFFIAPSADRPFGRGMF